MKEIDPPCPPCRAGNYTLCENFAVGAMPPDLGAGFGDRFVAHRSQLMPLPDDISDDDAVLIEPMAVSLHAVLKRPPLEKEKALALGADEALPDDPYEAVADAGGAKLYNGPLDRYQEAFQTIKKGKETVIKAVLDIAKNDFSDPGVRRMMMGKEKKNSGIGRLAIGDGKNKNCIKKEGDDP